MTVIQENPDIIKTKTIIVDAPNPNAKIVNPQDVEPERNRKGAMIVITLVFFLGIIAMIMIGLCFRQFINKPSQKIVQLMELKEQS